MKLPNIEWLQEALVLIDSRMIDKAEKENVSMYRVKDIIRIDIKEGKKNEES